MAVPGRLEQPVQVVDSTDLAALVLGLVEADRGGTYDAVGPAEPATLRSLVEACAEAAGIAAQAVAVDARRAPGMPLVTGEDGDAMFSRSGDAARAAGMPATPLRSTAGATAAWDAERGAPALAVELDPELEAQLLTEAAR